MAASRLDKTIKGIKSIELKELGATGLAVGMIGASSAALSSLGRYSTSLGPLQTVSDKMGPDGRLALQSLGIAASGIIVTEMMLADVKGGTFDMRKKKTRDLIQFSALGIAMYRLFTGLSLGGVGSTVSGMFDGHLDAFYGRQGPLVNTPAQMSEFKQIVNTNQIPNPGMPGQSMTVHTVNPNRLSQIMNSPYN